MNTKSVSLEQFLTYAAALIRTYGYVNSTQARESGKQSTGQLAWEWATKGRSNELLQNITIDFADRLAGKETAEWMEKLGEGRKIYGNDYLHNLYVIGKAGTVGQKEIGFAASAIQAWQRDTGKSGNVGKGNFLGKVGERISIAVTYSDIRSFESAYGLTHAYTFVDEQENIISWLTGKNPSELGLGIAGEKVFVTGTVKKHDTYKEIKQTQITRATIKR